MTQYDMSIPHFRQSLSTWRNRMSKTLMISILLIVAGLMAACGGSPQVVVPPQEQTAVTKAEVTPATLSSPSAIMEATHPASDSTPAAPAPTTAPKKVTSTLTIK